MLSSGVNSLIGLMKEFKINEPSLFSSTESECDVEDEFYSTTVENAQVSLVKTIKVHF